MKLKQMTLHAGLALLAMGVGNAALASGYNFGTQSARNMGTANAGAAEAADASTIYYNPAGLTNVEGTTASVDLAVVAPKSSFNFTQATTGAGVAVNPASNGGKFLDTHYVPHAYFSKQINDKYTVGVGVFVPFGASADFDSDFAGRYYIRQTELQSVNINPTLAIKLDDRNSVGIGVSAQYFDASLERDYNIRALVASNPATAAAAGFYAGASDSHAKVTGNDWGYGFNLGYMFKPNDDTRIGVAYRSQIKHELKGDVTFTQPTGLPPNIGLLAVINAGIAAGLANGSASVKVTTPESLSVNGFHKLDDKWSIMGDVTWTRHSRLQEIRINLPTSTDPTRNTTFEAKWKDTVKVSVGASYKLNDQWTLRGGYMYDQSPVPDAAHALTTLPDNDRHWFALGASYNFDKQNSIDFAYAYVKVKKASVNRTDDDYGRAGTANPAPGTLVGDYKTHANMFSIQYNHKF